MSAKEIIIDAAVKEFSEHGYHKATMDKIAESAGFSKGALYYSYKNKADLFFAVVSEGIELLDGKLNKLIISDKSAPDVIYLIIKAYVDLCLDNPQLALTILGENKKALDKNLADKIETLQQRILEQIKTALYAGQQMGFIKLYNNDIIAIAFTGMMAGICKSKIEQRINDDNESITKTLYCMVSSGISTEEH